MKNLLFFLLEVKPPDDKILIFTAWFVGFLFFVVFLIKNTTKKENKIIKND